MANIFSKLFGGGKFPSTNKFESQLNELTSTYKRFTDYEASESYKRYQELDATVKSGDFVNKVKQLKTQKFKDTQEFIKYKDFLTISKAADLKKYLKYVESGMPEKLDALKESDEKKYNKEVSSPLYKNYAALKGSNRLQKYLQLKEYVESEEFKSFKTYMEDKNKFKKSDENSLLTEHKEIEKSSDFAWYQNIKKKNLFTDIASWKLTFEENFGASALDNSKWITGYYWGKALLNDTYVLANEQQFFTDKNIQIQGGSAALVTKKESVDGKVWDTQYGFIPRKFDYTSGLISSGQSFRQLYGKFEAKVKVDSEANLTHAFWMVGESVAPQIDIFRFSKEDAKKYVAGIHTMDGNTPSHKTKLVDGADFGSDYYIYSLEWTKEKLTWSINGVKVHEQSTNVPQNPMYIVLSSHILDAEADVTLPKSMYIDWVKCYQKLN